MATPITDPEVVAQVLTPRPVHDPKTNFLVAGILPSVIHAPIDIPWTYTRTFNKYHTWNPFIRNVGISEPPVVGTKITLMLPGPIWPMWTFSPEKVSRIDDPRELVLPVSKLPVLEGYEYDAEDGTVVAKAAWLEYVYNSYFTMIRIMFSTRVQRFLEVPVVDREGRKSVVTVYETWDLLYGPAAHIAPFNWAQAGFEKQFAELKKRSEADFAARNGRTPEEAKL
ncbi:hypothetical protein BJ742DRAFT_826125 [Cladochytrium replicatum]|nr:hypothetical protein BJ742DRAFT_826125 [Cladochytrium replicatum]